MLEGKPAPQRFPYIDVSHALTVPVHLQRATTPGRKSLHCVAYCMLLDPSHNICHSSPIGGTILGRCGEGGIRTPGAPGAQRFSRPPHSAALSPLQAAPTGRDKHRPYHPGGPTVTASPPVRAHRSPTSRSYLRSRVRGVEGTTARPTLRTRGPATVPRTGRRTRAGAACWRAPAAGSSARRAVPRPGPARSQATPAGAP